jgi:hypothetical protein
MDLAQCPLLTRCGHYLAATRQKDEAERIAAQRQAQEAAQHRAAEAKEKLRQRTFEHNREIFARAPKQLPSKGTVRHRFTRDQCTNVQPQWWQCRCVGY